ncbi:Serine/threonine-protein phosphatase PP1-gamma catalytic subunit [Fusarium torreyae]|uniref:Serine/threonine-protein phosphatase PP1-gamma catalytic subunit n=1 Tax=Fusarium torreyae TaxID=1237075 RepID=A0A9W8VDP3_9HYPO|nr:Serine/threonine-protein phosphatase PP1-gamma catalytic subunit [Fusarium torreyae]
MLGQYLSRQDIETWISAPTSSRDGPGLITKLFISINEGMVLLYRVFPLEVEEAGSRQQCRNDIERFFLWGEGLSIIEGHLDEILAFSKELHIEVLSLLLHLGTAVLQGISRNWTTLNEDLGDQCDDLRNLLDTAEVMLHEADPEVNRDIELYTPSDPDTSAYSPTEIVEDVSIYVDCLLDLAPSLDNPALDVEASNYERPTHVKEAFSVSSDQALVYCRKIRDRFMNLPKSLVERLAEANVIRANRISELRSQPIKSEPGTNDNTTEKLFSTADNRFTETIKSTLPVSSATAESSTNWPGGPPMTPIPAIDRDVRSEPDTIATFSTAASALSSGRPRVPPMPKIIDDGFTCPICYVSVTNVKTRREWKKHVFEDLMPYICTVENCNETTVMHTHSLTWAHHEASHFFPKSTYRECMFCSAVHQKEGAAYFKHVAGHLQEISLSVLPQAIHGSDGCETEDSDQPASNMSLSGGIPDLPDTTTPHVLDRASRRLHYNEGLEPRSSSSSDMLDSSDDYEPKSEEREFTQTAQMVHAPSERGLEPQSQDTVREQFQRLNCSEKSLDGNSNLDPDEQNIMRRIQGNSDFDQDAEFLKRREQLKKFRRMSMGSSFGKRTHSEPSDSEDDGEGLDANEVGSSARRMRRKMHRTSLLFQDTLLSPLDEQSESGETDRLAHEALARELPYWDLDDVSVDDVSVDENEYQGGEEFEEVYEDTK